MDTTSPTKKLEFCVECKDGTTTFVHKPGKYCWRYIDNLVRSGTSEYVARRINFSEYLTCRAVKLLERIFGVNRPLCTLSTTTGYHGNFYASDTPTALSLRLSLDDMDAIIDCLQYSVFLDMRYRDFLEVEQESDQCTMTRTRQAELEKTIITAGHAEFKAAHRDSQPQGLGFFIGVPRGPIGPQGTPGGVAADKLHILLPESIAQIANDGEQWTLLWSSPVCVSFNGTNAPWLLRNLVTDCKNPVAKCQHILPIKIFCAIIHDPMGHMYWPVDQVLRAASSTEIVEAIQDYVPLGFGKRVQKDSTFSNPRSGEGGGGGGIIDLSPGDIF